MNIQSADNIVDEYLIHRGFTQTFRTLLKEKTNDRTKGFSATKIVEQIFSYIEEFEIESFVQLWDFLSKRFFLHLDQEHALLLSQMKSDLIKLYLVTAIKKNSKGVVTDFFLKYSHEILTESMESSNNLRSWYVLPYMDDPEKDAEFSVYFSAKWAEMLKLTLNNYLATILINAPPPRLLLLERWFRSESQRDIRLKLQQSSEKVENLISTLRVYDERLNALRMALKDLVHYVHHCNNTVRLTGDSSSSRHLGSSVGLFETDEEADRKRQQILELGQNVCRLSSEAVQKGSKHRSSINPRSITATDPLEAFIKINPTSKAFKTSLSPSSSSSALIDAVSTNMAQVQNQSSTEEIEIQLAQHLQLWLKALDR